MMKNSDKISVCLIVKNAEKTLSECLNSVAKFNEIIVLDNESSDKTLEIASEFSEQYGNLRIFKSEFIGFGSLKNLAISKAKNEWILNIDADEVLETSAFDEINALSLQDNQIYALPRKNHYANTWIKGCGWWPDFVLRLFNKNHTKFNENMVHESLIIPPNTQKIRLNSSLKHYAYDNSEHLLLKLQNYSTLWAKQNKHKKSSPFKAFAHATWTFLKNYFLKKGLFYGYKGFTISLCNALGAYFKYLKLYEFNKHFPSCSLIITTYNQKERLSLVLDSIKSLNYMPNEVLIADDGSRADTARVIENYQKNFPCLIRHIWQEDLGFRLARSRNLAINEAKGDYIIVIDGDMILSANFIKDHTKFAKKSTFLQGSRVILKEKESENILDKMNYKIAFNHKDFKAFRSEILAKFIYSFSKIKADFFIKKDLIKGVRGCNMSFFKNDFEKIGGFNEEFVGWGREDSEFVARLLFSGCEFRRLKHHAIAYHIWHKENPRADFKKNDEMYLEVIKKAKMRFKKMAQAF